jgi:hypothetical protein
MTADRHCIRRHEYKPQLKPLCDLLHIAVSASCKLKRCSVSATAIGQSVPPSFLTGTAGLSRIADASSTELGSGRAARPQDPNNRPCRRAAVASPQTLPNIDQPRCAKFKLVTQILGRVARSMCCWFPRRKPGNGIACQKGDRVRRKGLPCGGGRWITYLVHFARPSPSA